MQRSHKKLRIVPIKQQFVKCDPWSPVFSRLCKLLIVIIPLPRYVKASVIQLYLPEDFPFGVDKRTYIICNEVSEHTAEEIRTRQTACYLVPFPK